MKEKAGRTCCSTYRSCLPLTQMSQKKMLCIESGGGVEGREKEEGKGEGRRKGRGEKKEGEGGRSRLVGR